jgi:peptidyl-prolyl cis-trans isomerase D
MAGIKVPDDQIKAAYQKRQDEFVVPEKRVLQQILVPDETKAKAAEAALAKGQDFATVAKNIAGEGTDAVNLGSLTRADMSGDLAKAAFALKPGAVTAPIKDAFGWHIVKLVSVTPEKTQSLDSVKAKLTNDIAQTQAADQVAKIANSVDDALAGGGTFQEVVGKFNLKTIAVTDIDEQGHDAAGKPVALPSPTIVKTAFATSQGQPSDLKDLRDQGYYMVSVQKVTPAAPQPLGQVHDKVLSAWQDQERTARLEKLGQDYTAAIDKGQSLADLAALHGLIPFTTKPLSRYGGDNELPPAVTAKLFGVKQGQAVSGADGSKGVVVAEVGQILPPDPKDASTQEAAIARELERSVKSDLLAQYEQSLRDRFPVSVNRDALDRLL